MGRFLVVSDGRCLILLMLSFCPCTCEWVSRLHSMRIWFASDGMPCITPCSTDLISLSLTGFGADTYES